MKIFISADIEGVNGIVHWNETEQKYSDYTYFKNQMTDEVCSACEGANSIGVTDILIKDAHDSARNLIIEKLPRYVKLHRGWEGCPCSMMAGLDSSFDAVLFIGYHSAASIDQNPLSHTMNLRNQYIKINDIIASEFYINALYAAYLGVPVAFLSGDEGLTEEVKKLNPNIKTVATKTGRHGAVVSKHPSVTNYLIKSTVKESLSKDLSICKLELPKHFLVEIQYKKCVDAYNASFYPGCSLKNDNTVLFESDDYYEVLRALKFIL